MENHKKVTNQTIGAGWGERKKTKKKKNNRKPLFLFFVGDQNRRQVLGILFAASLRRVLRSDFLELTRARLLAVGRGLDADELTSDVQLGAAEAGRHTEAGGRKRG